jgi:Tol biopolymer transport system component
MDFGLAVSLDPGTAMRSQSGLLMGTPAYMATEQLAGSAVGVATDVYAFGVTLFEMLTGTNHPLVAPRSLVPDLPASWDSIILSCFERDPDKRPQSVRQVVDSLERSRRTASLRYAAIGAAGLVAAAVGLLWIATPAAPVSTPRTVTTKLTFDPGLTTDPAISSDGKMLAYSSDRGARANLNIWTQRLDTGEAQQLTTGLGNEISPAISPNNKLIAYRSEGEDAVFVVPVGGGAATRVGPWGQNPRFSPDGKWIAYWTGPENTAGSGRIWVAPVAGGPARQLVAQFSDARFPEWSEDSNNVLFRGNRSPDPSADGSDWWIVNMADGGVVHPGVQPALRSAGVAMEETPFTWRGESVIFAGRGGHSTNLWSLPLTQTGFHVRGGASRITTGADIEVAPAAGSDGRIVYASLRARANVWRASIATGELQQVTQGDSFESKPNVSRNGGALVYARRIGESRTVFLKDVGRDLTKGEEHEILRDQLAVPFISPDGRMCAWSTGPEIHVRRQRDGDTVVCPSCGELLGWMPDQSSLLFTPSLTRNGGTVELLDLAGGNRKQLIANANVREVSPSPDGRLLALTIRENGVKSRIFVAPTAAAGDEKNWVPATPAGYWADKPAWSNDGRTLFYSSMRDGFPCIWRRNLSGPAPQLQAESELVVHLHSVSQSTYGLSRTAFSLSAGGGYLYLNLSAVEGNLWALERSTKTR